MTWADREKRAQYVKAWNEKNKDERRARDRARYLANPAPSLEASRRYRAKLQAQGRTPAQLRRRWLSEVKVERGCEYRLPDGSLCGWRDHPAALEFNHIDPAFKSFAVSKLARGWDALLAEIAKCQVLCANHHRMVTATEGHYRTRREVEFPQLSLFEDAS